MIARLKFGLSPAIAVTSILCAFLAVRFNNEKSLAIKTLTYLGVNIEDGRPAGYYMEVPDLIDPTIAIECLNSIGNIDHIHFVPGESPPTTKAYLRAWSWDDEEASRRIDTFKKALPDTKFTFWPGAF